MRISDWSSDVCSSDLLTHGQFLHPAFGNPGTTKFDTKLEGSTVWAKYLFDEEPISDSVKPFWDSASEICDRWADMRWEAPSNLYLEVGVKECGHSREGAIIFRSEEHTSELQSLMRIS